MEPLLDTLQDERPDVRKALLALLLALTGVPRDDEWMPGPAGTMPAGMLIQLQGPESMQANSSIPSLTQGTVAPLASPAPAAPDPDPGSPRVAAHARRSAEVASFVAFHGTASMLLDIAIDRTGVRRAAVKGTARGSAGPGSRSAATSTALEASLCLRVLAQCMARSTVARKLMA